MSSHQLLRQRKTRTDPREPCRFERPPTESLEWATTTIRTRNGKQVVSVGPFVETKETVGGLFIIEARDLNEAIRIASMHPGARVGEDRGWAVEIRPIASGCHQ